MQVSEYRVTIHAAAGQRIVRTAATSSDAAKRAVADFEGCPIDILTAELAPHNRGNDRVASRYGAPMGRADNVAPGEDGADLGRFYLQRVRLDSGGYDAGGAYWGIGAPLYWYGSEDGSADGFIRGTTRNAAKAAIRETYPGARFFR